MEKQQVIGYQSDLFVEQELAIRHQSVTRKHVEGATILLEGQVFGADNQG